MSLSPDDVRWVTHLARIDVTPAELERLTAQLGAVLDYVRQLDEVETTNVEPLAHPLPVQNVFREDEPAPSLPRDAALANAPARAGDFYAVPAVLE